MTDRIIQMGPLARLALAELTAARGWVRFPNLRLSRAAKRVSDHGFAERRQRSDGHWEYRLSGSSEVEDGRPAEAS